MNTDYFDTKEKAIQYAKRRERKQTNPRYRNFCQTHFTAGDVEQFEKNRNSTNVGSDGKMRLTEINNINDNVFWGTCLKKENKEYFEGYFNLDVNSVSNTFNYMFHKFKKGIFVKIVNNKVDVFLPFSKVGFTNEYVEKLRFDPGMYTSMDNFLAHVSELEGRPYDSHKIDKNRSRWYANNYLIRNEYPSSESDTNVSAIKNMLETLCEEREVPDIEFFVNRRDFPVLKRNGTEPYHHIWDDMNKPLISYKYENYAPILSMCVDSANEYADVCIPTHEDWVRVMALEQKWFPKAVRPYDIKFDVEWKDKKAVAVFRGSSTGEGTTVDTNMRLKIADLSLRYGEKLDAGITSWNVRPRKLYGKRYLETLDWKRMGLKLVKPLSPYEQSKYKYIVNIDGHVSAFRLSLEFSMGSVILMPKSKWKMWFSDLLEPYVHYVPVYDDLENLIDQIEWCIDNDEECERIAANARAFYDKYLSKSSILDFLQLRLIELKRVNGIYLYNWATFSDVQLERQLQSTMFEKSIMPVENVKKEKLFCNKTGIVWRCGNIVYKETEDKCKVKEYIHEAFVGVMGINKLIEDTEIRVFNEVLGYEDKKVYSKYVDGKVLQKYIEEIGGSFRVSDLILVMTEIALALEIAQNKCMFVHGDVAPWNIIIRKDNSPRSYSIKGKHYVCSSIYVPVLIDYGKSHVLVNGMKYGSPSLDGKDIIKTSSVFDVISMILTCLSTLTKRHNRGRLSKKDEEDIVYVFNFLSNTKYCPKSMKTESEVIEFVSNAKKYTNLISSNKYELERLTPIDFVNHILKKIQHPKIFEVSSAMKLRRYICRSNVQGKNTLLEYLTNKITNNEKNTTYVLYELLQIINTLLRVIQDETQYNKWIRFVINKYRGFLRETTVEMHLNTIEGINKSIEVINGARNLERISWEFCEDGIRKQMDFYEDIHDYIDIIEYILTYKDVLTEIDIDLPSELEKEISSVLRFRPFDIKGTISGVVTYNTYIEDIAKINVIKGSEILNIMEDITINENKNLDLDVVTAIEKMVTECSIICS